MTNPPHTETELKLYTPDLSIIRQKLAAAGATETAPRIYERNVRYENEAGTLSEQGIVVRLRQDSRVRLTYKSAGVRLGNALSREELEVEVSDFETASLILERLGYQPFMIYEKYRTTYSLDGVEIVLDELPYGNFTELEGTLDAIERIVSKVGLDALTPYAASYSGLFDRVKHHLNLTMTDLTFDAFRDIDVPVSAFEDHTLENAPSTGSTTQTG